MKENHQHSRDWRHNDTMSKQCLSLLSTTRIQDEYASLLKGVSEIICRKDKLVDFHQCYGTRYLYLNGETLLIDNKEKNMFIIIPIRGGILSEDCIGVLPYTCGKVLVETTREEKY